MTPRRRTAPIAIVLIAALAACGDDGGDACKDGVTFAGAPVDYQLPGGSPTGAFEAPAAIASCPGSGPSYSVFDLTGDDATVGTTHWRLHAAAYL